MAMKIEAGEVRRSDLLLLDPTEILIPPDFNGRHFAIDPARIAEMISSLNTFGQLQPIRCRRRADFKVEIVSGFTRLAAALKIRETNAEFRIKTTIETALNDVDAFKANVEENRRRNDTNMIDDAYNIDKFMGTYGWSGEMVAEFYGMSKTKVSNIRQLKGLPERAQRLVVAGLISLAPALMLLKLTPEEMEPILAQRESLDAGEVETETLPDGGKLYPPIALANGLTAPIAAHTPPLGGPNLPAVVGDPNPEPDYGFDTMTGAPLGADGNPLKGKAAKAAKAKSAAAKPPKAPKIKGKEVAAKLRERNGASGNPTPKAKRTLSDLRTLLDGRGDDISIGIMGYLNGDLSPEDLTGRLDAAEEAAFDARVAGKAEGLSKWRAGQVTATTTATV